MYSWNQTLKMPDQGTQDVRLVNQEFIGLGLLSWDMGFNILASIPGPGANPLPR